jgi:hypothetical protein
MQTNVLTVPTAPGINPNCTIDTISPFDLDLNVVSTSAERGNPSSLGRTFRQHSDLGMNSDGQRVIFAQKQGLWNTNASFDTDINLTVGGPSEHNGDQGRSFSFCPNSALNGRGIFAQEQDLWASVPETNSETQEGIFSREEDLWRSRPEISSETQGGIFSREEDLWRSRPEINSETQGGIFSREEDLWPSRPEINSETQGGIFSREDLWPLGPETNSETEEGETQGIFSREEDLQDFGSTLNLSREHDIFNFDMRDATTSSS